MFKVLFLPIFLVTTVNCAVLGELETNGSESGRSYEGYKAYLVSTGSEKQMEELRIRIKHNMSDVIEVKTTSKDVSYLTPPDTATSFDSCLHTLGLDYEVQHDDFSKVIANEKRKTRRRFSWDAYYDIDSINRYLTESNRAYPNSTQLVKGGDSYEGRSIMGLRILTPEGETAKPAIVIESGIHAREWITPAASTYVIQQLLTSEDPNIMAMRDKYDWHIFPSVNPDGYQYTYRFDRMWRKTRSKSSNGCYGADPNRNWDHNWGKHGATNKPCDYSVYAGARPFSEIETSTFARYVSEVPDLRAYVALHADAQMLLVPYSDSEEHCDNYNDLIKIGKTSLQYGEEVNGAKYEGPATAAEILYKASGGSMDWVREALATPLVFTYELRGRFFHWPPSRIPEQGEELLHMLRGLLVAADSLGYF